MAETLERVRASYQFIVIDSAPLSGIADSLVLSQAVDGICMVVSRGRTPVDALGKIVDLLDQMEAPLLGVVYNSKDRRPVAVREAEGYYYGHYYRYGESSGARKKEA